MKKQKQENPRWKRNRTVQEGGAPAVPSGYARVPFWLLLVAFLGVSVHVFFFSPFMRISFVDVVGNSEISREDILRKVGENLEGKRLGLLPRNSYLAVSRKVLEENIADSFKKVRAVSVEKKFPDRLLVTLEERRSLLVWCSRERCFLVDEKGIAYLDADFSSREVRENHLVKIVEDDGKGVELDAEVMNEEMVGYYLDFKEAFRQKAGIGIEEEFHVESRLAEDAVARAEQGFDILVNFSIPAERSAELMRVFLDKQYAGDDLSKLAYVDLRVENKIFYKLKESEGAGGAEQEASGQPQEDSSKKAEKEKKD